MASSTGSFQDRLKDLINEYSMEGRSDTPDYILADYLFSCLNAFDMATRERDAHRGLDKTTDSTKKEGRDDDVQD